MDNESDRTEYHDCPALSSLRLQHSVKGQMTHQVIHPGGRCKEQVSSSDYLPTLGRVSYDIVSIGSKHILKPKKKKKSLKYVITKQTAQLAPTT